MVLARGDAGQCHGEGQRPRCFHYLALHTVKGSEAVGARALPRRARACQARFIPNLLGLLRPRPRRCRCLTRLHRPRPDGPPVLERWLHAALLERRGVLVVARLRRPARASAQQRPRCFHYLALTVSLRRGAPRSLVGHSRRAAHARAARIQEGVQHFPSPPRGRMVSGRGSREGVPGTSWRRCRRSRGSRGTRSAGSTAACRQTRARVGRRAARGLGRLRGDGPDFCQKCPNRCRERGVRGAPARAWAR
jgi:hypothetical protein